MVDGRTSSDLCQDCREAPAGSDGYCAACRVMAEHDDRRRYYPEWRRWHGGPGAEKLAAMEQAAGMESSDLALRQLDELVGPEARLAAGDDLNRPARWHETEATIVGREHGSFWLLLKEPIVFRNSRGTRLGSQWVILVRPFAFEFA
jgi:hypothetical protein